jgi:hypothetical protein
MLPVEHHHGGASGGVTADGLGLLPQSVLLVVAAAMAGIAAAQAGAWRVAPSTDRAARSLAGGVLAVVFAVLALTTRGEHFLRQAVTSGWTEQTWWALAVALLLLRVAADPTLWSTRKPARTLRK